MYRMRSEIYASLNHIIIGGMLRDPEVAKVASQDGVIEVRIFTQDT